MGWYYISCVLCGKKVKPQSKSLWCAKCETKTNLPIPRYRIQIEVFDSTDKTTFVIFDQDAEKILNKSAKDLAKKQTEIDIEEEISRDLKKILGRQYIFLLRLNEFNLKDGFENYTVAKIFDAPSNEKKIPMQNLSDNKPASTNFIRSTQESSSAISSMINTNDATKGTNDGTKGENDKTQKLNK
ncbi:replication protein A 70 kDa DNA-binding subunit D-like [Quercus suber]|uniref:replication protein A 70 kDa DNA-binding subunit D-like n=1 Tax=Quercus suber TaxID=58331 RepID=UPI0032DF5A40